MTFLRRSAWWVGTVFLLGLFGLGVFGVGKLLPSSGLDRPCHSSTDVRSTGQVVPPIALNPLGDEDGSILIPFGKSRAIDGRRVQFTFEGKIPDRETPITLVPSDFLRTENGGRLADEQVSYQWSTVNRIATIRVCVDPKNTPAGEYQGVYHVADRRFESRDIAVTTTIQYDGWHLVVAALILTVILAAFFKYAQAMREIKAPVLTRRTPLDFAVWCGSRAGSLGTGIVAVGGLFFAQYWDNLAWGSNPRQVLTLFVASFGAMVTAVSGGELAKPTTDKTFATTMRKAHKVDTGAQPGTGG